MDDGNEQNEYTDDEEDDIELYSRKPDIKPLIFRPSYRDRETKTCWKWTRTIGLLSAWITMGSFMEIAGPTLKDFVYRTGTSYAAVSGAVSGRSVGKFIGSILGGFFVDKFERLCYLFVALPLTVGAITTIILPMVYNINLLWFMYMCLGTVLGFVNIAGQRIIFLTWLEEAASPLHILHLGYGIGAFVVPLIANPFLAVEKTILSNKTSKYKNTTPYITNFSNNINSSNTTIASTTEMSHSRIQYAYVIIAAMTVTVAIIFYIFQCRSCFSDQHSLDNVQTKGGVTSRKKTLKEMINPANCADGNFCFGLTILLLMFTKYFAYTGCDRTIGIFIRSYAIDSLNFSKDDGSYINTLYWMFYSVGRFVVFIATRWISVKVVLLTESLFNFIVCLFMVLFAIRNSTALWVLTAFLGFGIGPMFPTGIGWGNTQIDMTGLAITWVMLGSASGGLVFLKISGIVYDNYGPSSFIYMLLVFSITILLFDIVLTIISILRTRISKESNLHYHGYELTNR